MYMLLNLLVFFGVQRIVSPETDSGFGSSYLNQSISGSFQANLLTERYKSIYTVTKKMLNIMSFMSGSHGNNLSCSVHSQNDALSCSDSEDSCSNLQTAVHSAIHSSQQWTSPHPSVQTPSHGAAVAVERWVENTMKVASVRLQREQILYKELLF